MKNYFLILVLLLGCTPQEFLISSSYQHWVGGRKESGSGTNYSFKLIAPSTDANFTIDKMYAHNNELLFKISPETFQKGDTLVIKAFKSEKNWNSIEKAEAKIDYSLYQKKQSLVIEELTEKEKLYYP